MQASKELFILYAPEDTQHLNGLISHLSVLRQSGLINIRADVSPAREEIEMHLNAAQIILLLVSAACLQHYSRELQRAIDRRNTGEALVIPILVRPTEGHGNFLGGLQMLPADGRPVSGWPDADQAWVDVIQGIRKACDAFASTRVLPDAAFLLAAGQHAHRQEQERLRTLQRILAALPTGAPRRAGGSQLAEMFARLLQGQGEILPLLKACEQYASAFTPALESLRDWGDQVARDFGVHPQLLAIRREMQLAAERQEASSAYLCYLLIVLEAVETDSLAFTVKAWLYSEQEEEADPLDAPEEGRWYREENMPDLLDELLGEIAAKSTLSDMAKDELNIEFFLPYRLLSLPVAHWRFAEGTGVLGARYQVVVRSLDRIGDRNAYDRSRASWKIKGEMARTLVCGMSPAHIHWLDEDSRGEQIYHRLEPPHTKILCLCFTQAPGALDPAYEQRALRAMCKAGTPIALWPGHPVADALQAKKFRAALRRLLQEHRPADLPAALLALRWAAVTAKKGQGDHLGHTLTLLWDDPKRPLPEGRLLPLEQRR
ncbi:MAG TPA: hypothetical protein VGF67_28850 [Ktedonobacteraceae bacterium]|jgi:hypothetical protein